VTYGLVVKRQWIAAQFLGSTSVGNRTATT